ncbi:MAG: carboxypeptidase-like regulatory domain-containing protein [Bacteroidota bacterium]|nr:carboxypeptidase-like regulatory domain-containing protein [Bacteroidota bacterium]
MSRIPATYRIYPPFTENCSTFDIFSLLTFMAACGFVTFTYATSGQTKQTALIAGKNVQLIGILEGDVTDAQGRFRFFTMKTGAQELRATMIGFEPAAKKLNLTLGDSIFTKLVLRESFINLKEVTVTASAYSTGDEVKGITLRSLEVLTTPGAAADIFRAIQTFPGVVAVDEGSRLFVRGGDVSETVILLDQATVVHPYKYESPTGGFFGTIPPFLVSGTFFSSGGFSARYGNALSGVLAMECLNLPKQITVLPI